MGNHWKTPLAAAIFCCSMLPMLASAQSPPNANLKLSPLQRAQGEDIQAWIETASLARAGHQAGAWVLRVHQFDKDGVFGKNSGFWVRVMADCQQRTTMDLTLASVSPTGEVRAPMQFPPKPPAVAKPGSPEARLVDGLCNPMPASVPVVDQVSAAIAATRNGTAMVAKLQSPTTTPAQPSAQMKRECAITYDTLANIAVARKMRVILGELGDADKPALEAASAAYRQRSRQADPSMPGVVLASESIKRQGAYDQAAGEARGPAKMAALNRLKAMAAECDRMLGLSAVDLP